MRVTTTRPPRSRFQNSAQPPPQPDLITRYGILPLRLFVAITFIYAGLQKLFDPGFFNPHSPTYIGTQMKGFATGSPIGFLFHWFAIPLAPEMGIMIIFVETTIGVLTLVGLWTRWAAVIGAMLSTTFFLSASWNVSPYFLGSDSIYAVAWVTLAIMGDQGVFSLERQLNQGMRPRGADTEQQRRLLLRGGAAVGLLWVLAILPRGRQNAFSSSTAFASPATPVSVAPGTGPASATSAGTAGFSTAASLQSGSTAVPTTAPTTSTAQPAAASSAPTVAPTTAPTAPAAPPTATAKPTATAAVSKPAGTPVGTFAQLQKNGGALPYQDPSSGDPAFAVALPGNKLVAYDAICTHAGCPVGFDPQNHLFLCPCHGSVFDPARGGEPLRGPASQPLAELKVALGPNGEIYAQS